MSPVLVASATLRAVSDSAGVIGILRDLGYATTKVVPLDASQLGLPGQLRNVQGLRSDRSSRKGHGVFLAETQEIPRSLRPLARALQRQFHDRPLGILGEPGKDGRWHRMVVFRPRRSSGRLGAVTVARLD